MSANATRPPARRPRVNALAHLFDVVPEGVFIGSIGLSDAARGATIAANPSLKSMFGYDADAPDASVLPFAADRFADPAAR